MPVSVLDLNLVFPCARKSVYVLSGERPTQLTSQNRRVFLSGSVFMGAEAGSAKLQCALSSPGT